MDRSDRKPAASRALFQAGARRARARGANRGGRGLPRRSESSREESPKFGDEANPSQVFSIN